MRKHNYKWITYITSLSLLVSSVMIHTGRKTQAVSTGIHTFERVATGQNNGLLRYRYIDENGDELQLPSGNNTSNRKRSSSLPSSYNSCEKGVVTPIKNQGATGGCWAFGAIKALESSSIQKGLSDLQNTDYSENHLLWYSYDPLKDTSHPLYGDYIDIGKASDKDIYDFGGNALIASFTLANWWGAVSEDSAPFSADTIKDVTEMAEGMKKADESLRFQSDIHLTEANCYDNASIDEIKQAVMDYGSLDVALYYNQTHEYTEDGVSSYYQNQRDSSSANHCVTIVGWDDSFHTFKKPMTPRRSGAWLIANSYGEDTGMNGYFWLSYYDTSLCEFYSFEGEPADTYDTSFQYDGCGWNVGYVDSEDIALANVFTNMEDSPRQIEAVSFYTFVDYQEYQVQVYRNVKNGSPKNGEPLSKCTVSGTAQRSGYHTIPLSDSFSIAPGERFSVVVTFHPSKATNNLAYALIEGESDPDNSVYYNSSPEQSYVYFASDNIWYDNTMTVDEDTATIQNNNNVCIKALGNAMSDYEFQEQEKNYVPETSSPVSSIQPGIPQPTGQSSPLPSNTEKPSATPVYEYPEITSGASRFVIGKGETIPLPVTVTPASSKKQLQYTSSDDNTAVVNKSGKVTGIRTGKASITISASGKALKTVSITVKKMPSTVRLKAGKTTIKKGKTTKLKTILSKKSASYKLAYRSRKPKIASVNANGIVIGKRKGTTWITVQTYNKKSARIKIHVVS